MYESVDRSHRHGRFGEYLVPLRDAIVVPLDIPRAKATSGVNPTIPNGSLVGAEKSYSALG